MLLRLAKRISAHHRTASSDGWDPLTGSKGSFGDSTTKESLSVTTGKIREKMEGIKGADGETRGNSS